MSIYLHRENIDLDVGDFNSLILEWVFHPKIGVKPPKWMVKIMENPIKIHDLGVPLFLETPE